MLPLFKVFSLLLRVASRPLINYAKIIHRENHGRYKHEWFRKFFIRLGLFSNRMENKINKKVLGNKVDDFFVKAITDNVAMEKGIEFFYEIVIYSILISFPLYEMHKGNISEAKK